MGNENRKNRVPIVGEWRLVSFMIRKESGEEVYPFGEDARGSIIYTESGRYFVQLTRADRPRFASGDQMKGTDEEIRAGYEGCISYYGPYEFDHEGGFVIHHVESSLFPNWEGHGQKRYVALSGNRLTLTSPPLLWGGGKEVIATVTWERIA